MQIFYSSKYDLNIMGISAKHKIAEENGENLEPFLDNFLNINEELDLKSEGQLTMKPSNVAPCLAGMDRFIWD